MNKFIFFILFLAVSFSYVFELDKILAKNLNPFDSLKEFFINTTESIKETKEQYFNQIETIKQIQTQNQELKHYKLKYEATKNQLNSVLSSLDSTTININDDIKFTRVLSYINFDNYTKVWLDLEKKDDSILGVISEDYAAGIVVNQDGRAKALLNGNEKSNYAIFIGKDKAPGIIHASKNTQLLIAKFIPSWFNIKKGDEVITSGMDNIFFEGLKVGRVVSIKKIQDIQEATIMPYAKVLKQKTFFVYKKPLQKKN